MANKINTLIGSDISIVGNISYEGVIHVEANVKGSLIANKERESKLFINSSEELKYFFKDSKQKFFQTSFYKSERKKNGLSI